MIFRIRFQKLFVIALVLGLVPASFAADKEKLAVTRLTAKGGISQDQLDVLADMVATELRKTGRYEVISKEDIESMLGLEKSKEFLGCDDASCMAEIGGALGVDLVVSGNVAKFGHVFAVNLKLINIKKAKVISSVFRKVNGEQALLDDMGGAVKEMVAQAGGGKDAKEVVSKKEPEPGQKTKAGAGQAAKAEKTGGGKFAGAGTIKVRPQGKAKEQAVPRKSGEKEKERVPLYWLGPLEFSILQGSIGPMSPVPESRFGLGIRYLNLAVDNFDPAAPGADLESETVTLEAIARVAIGRHFEVGAQVDLLNHVSNTISPGGLSNSSSDFGFISPYVKGTLFRRKKLALAASLGMLLPTNTAREFKNVSLVVIEPALHFMYRPVYFLDLHMSLPFTSLIFIPDNGSTRKEYHLPMAFGVSTMPWKYIGGFLDMQVDLDLNPDNGTDTFQQLNLLLGVRSRPIHLLYLEFAAYSILAGQLNDYYSSDYGIILRLLFTPNLF
ncbi:MAG: hypothetical protein GXP49_09080 [Deltaproteobacteria bacterium]|nr:hypothetical protein [Deltaproteobacteria bacterium]